MSQYRIVAAKPKGLTNHCNASFKVHQWGTKDGVTKWWPIGWKSINDITSLLAGKHEVMTGKLLSDGNIDDGTLVEVELRVATNGGKYNVNALPDI